MCDKTVTSIDGMTAETYKFNDDSAVPMKFSKCGEVRGQTEFCHDIVQLINYLEFE